MAKFTKTLSGDSRYSIELTVTEQTPVAEADIVLNRSRVDWTLKAIKSSGSGYYTSSKTNTVKVTLGGTEVVNKKIAYDFTGSTPKTITLANGTGIIQHDADGSKTISCKGYFKDVENSLGNATASGNLTLTQLHKAPDIDTSNIQIAENVLYLKNTIGIQDDWFVNNVSIKSFTINATPYDDASIVSISMTNGEYTETTTNITNNTGVVVMNFQEHPIVITRPTQTMPGLYNRIYFEITAIDSKGGVSKEQISYNISLGGYSEYTKPLITDNPTTAKRLGQLSGQIKFSVIGNYTTNINSESLSPTLTLNVYESDSDEIIYTRTFTNNDTEFEVDEPDYGLWRLKNLVLGGTSSINFDPQKMYDIVAIANDEVTTNVLTITPHTKTMKVLEGEPTWTEYKDRVDFKRITRQKGEVYGETILYDDDTGTNDSVSLTKDSEPESCANYEYVEIFYYTSSGDYYGSSKIYLPNGKNAQLKAESDDGTYNYVYTANYTFNNATLTRNNEYRWRLSASGVNRATTSTIYIYRVVGYK